MEELHANDVGAQAVTLCQHDPEQTSWHEQQLFSNVVKSSIKVQPFTPQGQWSAYLKEGKFVLLALGLETGSA